MGLNEYGVLQWRTGYLFVLYANHLSYERKLIRPRSACFALDIIAVIGIVEPWAEIIYGALG